MFSSSKLHSRHSLYIYWEPQWQCFIISNVYAVKIHLTTQYYMRCILGILYLNINNTHTPYGSSTEHEYFNGVSKSQTWPLKSALRSTERAFTHLNVHVSTQMCSLDILLRCTYWKIRLTSQHFGNMLQNDAGKIAGF